MTTRELNILKALLTFLKSLDGGQAVEAIIHANISANITPRVSMGELNWALQKADAEKWILGAPGRIAGKMKWSITDQGTAALMQMEME